MEQGTTQASNNSMKTGIIAVALIALLIGGAVFYTQSQRSNNTTQNATPTGAMTQTTEAPTGAMMQEEDAMMASNYQNGTYEATGAYVSPGGPEEIGVSVTLTDGIITAATVTPMTERATSQRYQGIFQENFSPLVIGKNIDEVQLDKVSGSSLAPKGFNDALTKIKQQAQS